MTKNGTKTFEIKTFGGHANGSPPYCTENIPGYADMDQLLINEKPLINLIEVTKRQYILYFDALFSSFTTIMKLFDAGNSIGHFLRRIMWET